MDQRSDDGTLLSAHTVLSSMKNEISILEELEIKFGAAKNKTQIIHALEHSAILHRIPVPMPNASTEQARKDFRRERVLLNDVPFIPDKIDVDRCNAFSMTLSILLERMSRIPDSFDKELYPDFEALTAAVMQRACRTGAGADSFFMVQKLLCVEGTFVTQRTFMNDSPIKIDVFLAPEPPNEFSPDPVAAPPSARKEKASLFGSYKSNNSSYSAHSGIALSQSQSMDQMDRRFDSSPPAVLTGAGTGAGGASGTVTPPSTPPVGRSSSASKAERHGHKVHHIGIPSPLKVGLRNMGIISGGTASNSKAPKPLSTHGATPSTLERQGQGLGQGRGLGVEVGPGAGPPSPGTLLAGGPAAFTPPSTPSGTTGHGNSFSFSASGSADDVSLGRAEGGPFQPPPPPAQHSISNNVGSSGTAARVGIAQAAVASELPVSPLSPASNSGAGVGGICARVQVMNAFAIYDVAAIEEITGVAGQDPDPWLEVEAVVIDESNFSTNQHSRKLQLIVTCPASGKVYTSAPDPSSSGRHSGRLSGRRVLAELSSWFSHLPHHHVHLHMHWGHHHHHHHGKGHDQGQPASASDSGADSVPSNAPVAGTPARTRRSPADEATPLLAKGEAALPDRSSHLSLSLVGSGSSSNSNATHGQTVTDSTVSAPSVATSPVLEAREVPQLPAVVTLADQLPAAQVRRFSSGADLAQHTLHDQAVAALLQPSPAFPSAPHPFQDAHLGLGEAADTDGCSASLTDSDVSSSAGDVFSSSSSEYAGTGTMVTGPAYGVPLPVRTHEDLDLLIPSLRLLESRSRDSSSSSDDGVAPQGDQS
jgi:hypothetical protein